MLNKKQNCWVTFETIIVIEPQLFNENLVYYIFVDKPTFSNTLVIQLTFMFHNIIQSHI